MPKRIEVSTLQGTTLDILNTIRANASAEYRDRIPEVTSESDIPAVGEVLYGYPALANEFISTLVNRIALVQIQSATFNNPYAALKKGYIEFGETIEQIFTEIAKVRDYSVEKAPAREFKRTLPDVRTAFHAMNWQVQYPVTIQQNELRMAFTSANGVADLIAKIMAQVYTAAEYDEYLLFKYLIIKAVSAGKMKPIAFDATDMKKAAVEFRALSNDLTFMHTEYNEQGVHQTTPKNKQFIFMDSRFNAMYDVDVLAAAFNMDKATFTGNLHLIDSWTEFDNARWADIRSANDSVEEVTAAELALMADVKAVVVDGDWFQVYDNLTQFTETHVASGMYWNYFLNVWKTISHSPFHNAAVLVDDSAAITEPATLSVAIVSKSTSEDVTVFTLSCDAGSATLAPNNALFVQTDALTQLGIAVHPYGAVMIPASKATNDITLVATLNGKTYTATTTIKASNNTGDTVSLSKG